MTFPLIGIPVQGGQPWQCAVVGTLPDAETCTVRQEYNTGLYELYMQYVPDGRNAQFLQNGNYIICKSDNYHAAQTFMISRIHRTINGLITLTAYHISYMHSNEIVVPFLNNGAQWTAKQAWDNTVNHITNPYSYTKTCTIDSTEYGAFGIHALQPQSFRSFILEQLIPAYGGAIEWNEMNVTWEPETNPNRGIRLQGCVDVTEISTDADISEIETGIFAFYGSANSDTSAYISAGIVNYGIDLPEKIIPMDFTSKFETRPTVSQLLNAANAYKEMRISEIQPVQISVDSIPQNGIIIPGDTVQIRVRQLDIDVLRTVTAINYDVLRGCVDAVEVGSQKSTLAKIISSLR